MQPLRVEFFGDVQEVKDRLTFGRKADLVLDEDNDFMHRVCGEIVFDGTNWTLLNRSDSMPLRIIADSGPHMEVPPLRLVVLPMPSGRIALTAGPTPYDFAYFGHEGTDLEFADQATGRPTSRYGGVLTPRQKDFLLTFARPEFEGIRAPTPTTREVAALWGVYPKTVDSALQTLRSNLKQSGVQEKQINTLELLIHHVMSTGKLTRSDFDHADFQNPCGPFSARDAQGT